MQCFIVDAFTDVPFRGNPAGVCLVEASLSENEMLQVAREFNLSETAFLQERRDAGVYSIRYFSPKQEIPLCGHATLASAKVLFSTRGLHEVRFVTAQNVDLTAVESGQGIEMVFPTYPTQPAAASEALLTALGVESAENVAFNVETGILLVEIADAHELATLSPDFPSLYQSHDAIQGVLVTAPSGDDGYDFHSRYFWPWSGTDEDPVTGATHTFLTGYWSTRLGKTKMRSFQSSARTGSMEVELSDGQLLIRGQAVIVLEGRMPFFEASDPG